MKQITVMFFMGAAVFFMFSCGTFELASKYPDMVADADPVSAGTAEAAFDRIFSSKLKKIDIEVIFYPRLNAVALEFKHEFINYRQFWSEKGRQQFVSALNLYKADFESRNLDTRYRKTRAIYGKAQGRVEWESFKFTRTREARPIISLGYRFRNGSPFFATLMNSAKVENPTGNNSDTGESQQIHMYFTRAQAEELVKLFDQSYLLGLLNKKDKLNPDESFEADYYSESE